VGSIRLDRIDKVYDNGFHAVKELSLSIEDGEFLVLVGPSGCGKSTALRMIAGLEEITGGQLWIADREVSELEPKHRDIAMVFQSYALYPHLSVRDNIAFPLKLRKVTKAEAQRRVEEAARILELTSELDKRPAQLSGGQRQRVAMGRAIVRQPSVFLMDEPLSNLDAKLRVQMRAEISALQRSLGTTTVYVTHDQVEAMTMGTRVAVLSKGSLQQVDTPQRLYDAPANLFVATFIGSPQMNALSGTVELADGGARVRLGEQVLELPPEILDTRPGLAEYDGRDVVVGIRPESMEDLADGGRTGAVLTGEVLLREGLGSEVLLHVRLPVRSVAAGDGGSPAVSSEGSVTVIARVSPSSESSTGSFAQLHVDTGQLHFFDPLTGSSIARVDQQQHPAG
jgi:multiple sugar transport system ATP-binding protein